MNRCRGMGLWAVLGLTLLFTSGLRAVEVPVTGLPSSAPAELELDADVLASISERMQKFVDQHETASVVTLVARRGKTVHLAAVGKADIEADRPAQVDDLYAIASMTKPIAATALMILIDEGKVSLDDPISKYIPEFAEVTCQDEPLAEPITIRHAMTHTSGMGGSQRTEVTLEATAKMLAKQNLDFRPGVRWQYSPGLTVAARVLEVASGKPFAEFLQERIFTPLKMNHTTFTPSAEQRKRLVRLYQPSDDKESLVAVDSWIRDDAGQRAPNPSAGILSTAGDLARFYQMILNDGQLDGVRILSAEAVEQMTTIHTGEFTTAFTPGNGWGLGWCVLREPQGVTAMLLPGSCGHGGAFGTQGWIDPTREMIFVMLIQRTGFGNGDASDLRRVFQQTAVDALQK